jgi:hypothetical protein
MAIAPVATVSPQDDGAACGSEAGRTREIESDTSVASVPAAPIAGRYVATVTSCPPFYGGCGAESPGSRKNRAVTTSAAATSAAAQRTCAGTSIASGIIGRTAEGTTAAIETIGPAGSARPALSVSESSRLGCSRQSRPATATAAIAADRSVAAGLIEAPARAAGSNPGAAGAACRLRECDLVWNGCDQARQRQRCCERQAGDSRRDQCGR